MKSYKKVKVFFKMNISEIYKQLLSFQEYFGKAPIDDPEEKKARNDALKENEKEIKEVNQKYQRGEISWFDGVNEFADLPNDKFLATKTGANVPKQYGYGHGRGLLADLVDMPGKIKIPTQYGRGLLEPTEEERVDEASERYFDQFRSINRASVPSSYSSVDNGRWTEKMIFNFKLMNTCLLAYNVKAYLKSVCLQAMSPL